MPADKSPESKIVEEAHNALLNLSALNKRHWEYLVGIRSNFNAFTSERNEIEVAMFVVQKRQSLIEGLLEPTELPDEKWWVEWSDTGIPDCKWKDLPIRDDGWQPSIKSWGRR